MCQVKHFFIISPCIIQRICFFPPATSAVIILLWRRWSPSGGFLTPPPSLRSASSSSTTSLVSLLFQSWSVRSVNHQTVQNHFAYFICLESFKIKWDKAPNWHKSSMLDCTWAGSAHSGCGGVCLVSDERCGRSCDSRRELLPGLHGQHRQVHELLQHPQGGPEPHQDLVRLHLEEPGHAG